MNKRPLILFIKLSRPLFLLAGALFYALGAGIARYLGFSIDASLYWLGQIAVSVLQLTAHYLNEYFDWQSDRDNKNRSFLSGGSGALGEGKGKLPENLALLAAASSLTVFVLTVISIQRTGGLNPLIIAILVMALFGAVFYSVPPVRLVSSGFGELSASFILTILVPAFGLVLQTGSLHRLLAMTSFPLMALAMAAMLSFEFSDYASDKKHGKQTLLQRLDWAKGIQTHALFLMSAYALIAIANVFGLPRGIAFPALYTLPLAGLQIWLFRRIEDGLKPNWPAITLTSMVNVILVLYLFVYAFWTR